MKEKNQMHHVGREKKQEPIPPKMLVIDRLEIVTAGDKDTGIMDEVLLLIKAVHGCNLSVPFYAPFTTPDMLKTFIEELIRFRREVWADAAPINVDAMLPLLTDKPSEKLTLHQRFTRLQEKLITPDGFRHVKRTVAERFCQRFTARITTGNRLLLDFDHPDIGEGQQLIAFVVEDTDEL